MPLLVRLEGKSPLKVYLEGSIDEFVDLDQVFGKLSGKVVLDLNGVGKINSIGILRWIPKFTEYSTKNPVEIVNVSYTMVFHANSILNLFGKAQILSCSAPYFCGKCGKERLVEISRKSYLETRPDAPVIGCPECHTQMTFDEASGFFAFFERT